MKQYANWDEATKDGFFIKDGSIFRNLPAVGFIPAMTLDTRHTTLEEVNEHIRYTTNYKAVQQEIAKNGSN